MIIFISDGRLGNQLFQYAFLNTIAKNKEYVLCIGMHLFVESFNNTNPFFKHILNKYFVFLIRKIIKPYLLDISAKYLVIGYIKQDKANMISYPSIQEKKGILPIRLVESHFFQSQKFFIDAAIDFLIKESNLIRAQEFLSDIPYDNTPVFVHVRRGDYINEVYMGEKGLDLPRRYYVDAINIIDKSVANPFFIFLSDDPSYVECCFQSIKQKKISKETMQVDFAIMTLCSYGIVSNSSFSWWGAYLMKNRIKVIFPKYWYGWKKKVESHVGIQPSWATQIDVRDKDMNY